jgi:hypothetical protein
MNCWIKWTAETLKGILASLLGHLYGSSKYCPQTFARRNAENRLAKSKLAKTDRLHSEYQTVERYILMS